MTTSTQPRSDVYSRVTAKIIADLEQGVRTWQRPWNADHATGNIIRPRRANGMPYRGVNVLLLWGEAFDKGYTAPMWMTYKQATTLGAQVRKGEHDSLVVYADRITKTATNDQGKDVERAFRSMKTIDLKVRPIHHRLENRVRAHIFLCMLAYYVEWHLREAWRELMFADTEQQAKASRDPVAPAERATSAQDKAATHLLIDGTPAHSFSTLMAELATIVRNTCRTPNGGAHAPTFEVTTTPEPMHQRAFALVQAIKP